MDDPGKEKNPEKEKEAPPEKGWDNPGNPEETHDQRDKEQIARKIEEARRRKENLTTDKN